MYRVSKAFTFSSAHRLVPPYRDGKCARLHGHTWRVEIVVASEILDSCGMVMDFHDFAPLAQYIEQRLDHSTINDTIEQPTAENIARHLYDWALARWHVERVRVWESESAYAEYSR